MSSLRIAAAQSCSLAGDLCSNTATHLRFIAAASAARADLLVFPELSLSGYELPLLQRCALQADDPVFAPLREAASAAGMIVVVGAPVASEHGLPGIGAFAFFPDGQVSVYRKQYLHPGEERFAAAGAIGCVRHPVGDEHFALAICADTNHAAHADAAGQAGVSLYLAGVLITEAGYAADSAKMRSYARSHRFAALMANHGGPSGGHQSAGKSALWDEKGDLIVVAPDSGSWLLVGSRQHGAWTGERIAVDA